MARLEAPWLEIPAVQAVIAALGRDNARFVGGAVRDSLLGRPVADIDLATILTPDAAKARLEASGIKVVPTGIAHGTVTAIACGQPFEVTTLRHDVETFGRHARVSFTDDWQADAARRDFTMNALYAEADGSLHDYFDGIDDARAGRVRFIGDATARIGEDALRILRFFRFYAHYGRAAPDSDALIACAALAGKLDILSVERIRNELLKLLGAPDPVPALRAAADAGVLPRILPELAEDWLERLLPLVTRESGFGLPDPLRRLAALLGCEPTALAGAGRRLRLSNHDATRLAAMAGPAPAENMLERIAYRDGVEAVVDRLLLAGGDDHFLAKVFDMLDGWTRPQFPLKGRDLTQMGIAPGPEMGRCLARLEAAWIESGFTLDRKALLARFSDMQETG